MLIKKTRILNIDILSITQNQLLDSLNEGVLLTPNIDHLVKLQKDESLYKIYKAAEWVICDSKVLYFLANLFGYKIIEPIPGSSFFTAFYMHHKDDLDCSIYLLGAKPGVAAIAMDEINRKVGRKIVVDSYSPSFGFENREQECEAIIDKINKSHATVLLVGVGAPKQEKWIFKYRSKLTNVKLFMALGATIDFEAKTLTRAPLFMQNLGLEWLYRLLQEPKRLWRRFLVDDTFFFVYFIKQLFGTYKNPFN